MPLAHFESVTFLGLDALPIEIEVDSFEVEENASIMMVGLPDVAVKESKDRVKTAIKNSGFQLNMIQATVNLAPGHLKKEGPLYDLPIALGLLLSGNHIKTESLKDYLIVGELGLNGQVRPIRGTLAMAMLARSMKKKGVIVPAPNAKEAAAVPGIDVIPVNTLRDAAHFLEGKMNIPPVTTEISEAFFSHATPSVDFSDIKGQSHVKRAMEIAAAGGHNILLSGPPGSGKTMIAKAMLGIMPALTVDEALDATKIHSIAGMITENQSIISERPFRSPHHTISYGGLILSLIHI